MERIVVSTDKLGLLYSLGKIFSKGITPEWLLFIADSDETVVYGEYGIISHKVIDNNIRIINSGTLGNGKFTFSMIKDIRKLIIGHNRVVVQCSYKDRFKHLADKLGLEYENGYYFKE